MAKYLSFIHFCFIASKTEVSLVSVMQSLTRKLCKHTLISIYMSLSISKHIRTQELLKRFPQNLTLWTITKIVQYSSSLVKTEQQQQTHCMHTYKFSCSHLDCTLCTICQTGAPSARCTVTHFQHHGTLT